MARVTIATLVAVLAVSCSAIVQANGPSAPATVTFTFDFPQSTPNHYSIVVDSCGKASYASGQPAMAQKQDADSDTVSDSDQPYHYDFTVTPVTRERIFDLAAKANYFSEKLEAPKRNIANTGDKTLDYKDAQRNGEVKYNYTSNPTIQQLTTLFQEMSSTLEYGRHLEEAYHFQKLALDDQLKSMEQQADQNALLEIQAVAPILKKIVKDSSVMNVSRARAEKLLAKAEGNSSAR